jgi:ATP-binding cassette subfamily B protein
VVKSYVREDHEKEKFNEASGTLYHDFVHVERILAWNQPLMTLAIDVIYTFVIFFGSQAIVSSQGQLMGVGQLSALITYGFSMLMSLMMLSMVFVMITMADESRGASARSCARSPTSRTPRTPSWRSPTAPSTSTT